jgi:hypothetical protein
MFSCQNETPPCFLEVAFRDAKVAFHEIITAFRNFDKHFYIREKRLGENKAFFCKIYAKKCYF